MGRAVRKIYEYSAQCGARIRSIRQQRRLTLKQLADRVGVSQQMMSKFERGEANIPTESMKRIALALDVLVLQLFPESDEQEPKRLTRMEYWLEHERPQHVHALQAVVKDLETLSVS